MSAFICCDAHISAIVGWYGATGRLIDFGESYQETEIQKQGQLLLNENYRSVNHRYHEEGQPRVFQLKHEFVSCPVDALSCIKACYCLDYQSCETDDWETTEAHALMSEIILSAVRSLPGYHDAPWEISEHPTKTRQPTVPLEVNAHLAAAAPDLLEQLEAFRSLAEEILESNPAPWIKENMETRLDCSRYAIDKAWGLRHDESAPHNHV